jgi:hypothetical protein
MIGRARGVPLARPQTHQPTHNMPEEKDRDSTPEEPARKATAKKTARKATAKKTARKTTTKKTARKTTTSRGRKPAIPIHLDDPDDMPVPVYKRGFDASEKGDVLLGMVANVRKSLDVLSERSKLRPVVLSTPAQLQRALTPFDEPYFQYMIDSIGLRTPTAIELVAQESVGSTSWVFDTIGRLLDLGFYSIYCECEDKPMANSRIKRLLDRDPAMAKKKLNSVVFASARNLNQFDDTLRKTVADMRERCDDDPRTKGNPIFFFGDPWSGLMSTQEAVGNDSWGVSNSARSSTSKKGPKDTTAGSNLGHSQHAQALARWLPSFMKEFNCSVVFVNKQNDKIDMDSKPAPSYMKPSPFKNDTRLGGRAFRRLCSYRFTLMTTGDIKDSGVGKSVYGHDLRMTAVKNSYGPKLRYCELSLMSGNYQDIKGEYQSPAITYARRTAHWMSSQKLLGTTVTNGLYTCDALGCVAVTADELHAALMRSEESRAYIGSVLGIEGYADPPTTHLPAAAEELAGGGIEGSDSVEDMLVP